MRNPAPALALFALAVLITTLEKASALEPQAPERIAFFPHLAEERKKWNENGVDIDMKLMPEGFDNFYGGKHSGTAGALMTDLILSFDAEKGFGWPGGTFFLDLEDRAGRNPSKALVGDLQSFDQYNFKPYFEIFELWYQQFFWMGKLRIKIGKVDANTEFSVIDNGLSFLNASTQVSPTILSFPTTPDPSLSINVFFKPVNSWYASLGVYAANRHDKFGIFSGHPQDTQHTEYGAMAIGETGFTWKHAFLTSRDGNLKLGLWRHTGTFPKIEGGKQHGAVGFYAIFDQTLWQPEGEPARGRGIRCFISAGQTQKSVGIIDWNVSCGLTWTGMFESRQEDMLGFSPNYAHISSKSELPHGFELALEWIYLLKISGWATLKNDLQYIIHPGGQYPNALVGTLHFEVHL